MQFNSRTRSAAAGASTKENPRRKYATGSAGLAPLVRGSSRRIMIMRFRPANISLINRRHYLPRLPLTLSSFEKKRPAHLDRSLDITSESPTNDPEPVNERLGLYPTVEIRDGAGRWVLAALPHPTLQIKLDSDYSLFLNEGCRRRIVESTGDRAERDYVGP